MHGLTTYHDYCIFFWFSHVLFTFIDSKIILWKLSICNVLFEKHTILIHSFARAAGVGIAAKLACIRRWSAMLGGVFPQSVSGEVVHTLFMAGFSCLQKWGIPYTQIHLVQHDLIPLYWHKSAVCPVISRHSHENIMRTHPRPQQMLLLDGSFDASIDDAFWLHKSKSNLSQKMVLNGWIPSSEKTLLQLKRLPGRPFSGMGWSKVDCSEAWWRASSKWTSHILGWVWRALHLLAGGATCCFVTKKH